MGARLAHRGAQGREWSPAARVLLGHRSRSEIADPPGFVTFDGVLDNRDELHALLGMRASDGAAPFAGVLAWELYRKFGVDGFSRLSGQFALALWDASAGRLVMARDRWGARTIYYARSRGRILFASEYKALLAVPDLPARPDPDAILYAVRTHHGSPHQCFLDGVEMVPRGAWQALQGERVDGARFWDIAIDIADRTETGHAADLRSALLDALQRQTVSLDPLGVALSGGLDSALVLAGMRRIAPEKTVHTFTVGHGGEDHEIVGARESAGHFKTEHHEIVVDSSVLPRVLPEAIWYMEDPVGGEELIYQFIAAREAAQHVNNVFTGHKSDVLFGGMPRHQLVNLAIALRPLRTMLEEFFHYTQTRRMPQSLPGRLLVKGYFRGADAFDAAVIGAKGLPLSRPIPFDTAQPLNEKLRGDILDGSSKLGVTYQVHVANGLTWNSPFMDSELVRRAFQIPDRLKIRRLRQKYVLRRACEGLVPQAILERKKSLQRLRHDAQLTGVLEELADSLLSPAAVSARGIFRATDVERIRRRGADRLFSKPQISALWSLLLTEIWAQSFLDNRGQKPLPAG